MTYVLIIASKVYIYQSKSNIPGIMSGSNNWNCNNLDHSIKKTVKKEGYKIRKRSAGSALDDDYANDSAITLVVRRSTPLSTLKIIVRTIKTVTKRLNYTPDTYLACLILLDDVKSNIPDQLASLTASTIILMTSKIYQHKFPMFKDLYKWTKGEFQKQQLVLFQAKLLELIDYQIPILDSNLNQVGIQKQITKLQKQLCSFDGKNG